MQNLKDKQAFEAPKLAQDEKKAKPIEGIPDIHEVMRSTGLACEREGLDKAREAEAKAKTAEERAQARADVQRREERARERRTICCCGSPGCSIGPMVYEER
jgi:hypothetical protein